MATNKNSTILNKKASLPPPRRGQIKAQIFSGMVKFVASKFSKGDGDLNNGGASAKSTPPPSDYNSDGL
ncbi:hypothetical protein Fmac_022100 [Flemingia macrophylla]|uniref:Uncharacterized protein n=1 Tax=Flemingia macrophylla TaxID=520843 RepID=A0ABD1LYS6_9FABA